MSVNNFSISSSDTSLNGANWFLYSCIAAKTSFIEKRCLFGSSAKITDNVPISSLLILLKTSIFVSMIIDFLPLKLYNLLPIHKRHQLQNLLTVQMQLIHLHQNLLLLRTVTRIL